MLNFLPVNLLNLESAFAASFSHLFAVKSKLEEVPLIYLISSIIKLHLNLIL